MDLPTGGKTPPQFPKLYEVEIEHMIKALTIAKGNMTLAAEMLGIGRATMYRRCPTIKEQAKELARARKTQNAR